jgi:hypothetical protein
MPDQRPVVLPYNGKTHQPVAAPLACPRCGSHHTRARRRGAFARFAIGFLVIMPVIVCVGGMWFGPLMLLWLLLLPISVPLLFSPGPKCRCMSCGHRWLAAYERA